MAQTHHHTSSGADKPLNHTKQADFIRAGRRVKAAKLAKHQTCSHFRATAYWKLALGRGSPLWLVLGGNPRGQLN
jgi:hypothetical protein